MQFAKDSLWLPYREYFSEDSAMVLPFAEEESKSVPLPTMLQETRLVDPQKPLTVSQRTQMSLEMAAQV